MIRIDFDFDKIIKKLDGVTEGAQKALRPAAQAGAQVFYDEARLRAPVSEHAHFFYGRNSKKSGVRYFFKSGNLRNSIYQYYNKRESTPKRAVYSISWNHREAPYGFMVEYGTSRAPAHPWLRPTYDSAAPSARAAVLKVMKDNSQGVVE